TKEGSSKHRRLGIVALLAVALGVAFWLLKPSTPETVEELQSQQGGSLPIEFRPVDEAEAQRQEAEAKAQAQAQQEALAQQQNQQQAQLEQQTQQPAQQVVSPVEKTAEPQPVQPVANELAQSQSTLQASQSQPMTVVTEKPATQGSVVYQPETPTAQVVQPKVEKLKASHHANNKQVNAQPKVKAVTKAEFDTKKSQNAQLDRLVKNVETGKPVVEKATPAPSLAAKTEAAKSQNVVTLSKTLSVPKGVSLMQVFRDNQLNISDVNAMSKVNNKVSSLKVNEKVTVRLDKNNRVVEMTIGSGGKFTRQIDGTYRFK
ncbi:MAG: LysM-like peptidoglycan-binding domain-containing protein, partial [Haemophilus parahaemolyticus]